MSTRTCPSQAPASMRRSPRAALVRPDEAACAAPHRGFRGGASGRRGARGLRAPRGRGVSRSPSVDASAAARSDSVSSVMSYSGRRRRVDRRPPRGRRRGERWCAARAASCRRRRGGPRGIAFPAERGRSPAPMSARSPIGPPTRATADNSRGIGGRRGTVAARRWASRTPLLRPRGCGLSSTRYPRPWYS
jgi:hypothetical protein